MPGPYGTNAATHPEDDGTYEPDEYEEPLHSATTLIDPHTMGHGEEDDDDAQTLAPHSNAMQSLGHSSAFNYFNAYPEQDNDFQGYDA